MGLLERQLLTRQTIPSDLFCANCGYNLRTRAVISRCPECGSDYDARPVKMTGILRDEDVQFPLAAWGLFLLCGAMGGGFIYGWAKLKMAWNLGPAILLFVMAAAFAVFAMIKSRTYLRHRALLRQTNSKR